MGKPELKYIFIAAVVLAILVVPMVGFTAQGFDGNRALMVWVTTFVIAAVGIIGSGIKSRRAACAEGPSRWTMTWEAAGERFQAVPAKYYLVGLSAFLLAFPLLANNYMVDVCIICLIYISLGLGLNITIGLVGLFDMGYVAFYAVGAYTFSLLNLKYGLGFWTCLPICMIFGSLLAAMVGYPTFKARIRGDFLAIVTLGFAEITRLVLNNWDALTAGPDGLMSMAKPALLYPTFSNGSLALAEYSVESLSGLYYIILLINVVIIIVVNRLNNSRVGRAWVAIREDETAAELCGLPTTALKLLAYALGGAIASVSGAFFATKLSYTNPSFFILMESCVIISIVVLGGSGSVPGVILGGVLLVAIPEIFRDLQAWRMLAFGVAMTVMMIIRPEGLIPASRKKRELHNGEACEPINDLDLETPNER